MTPSPELDSLAIDSLRALAMDAVEQANSGHPGTPMALAPLGWLLYSRVLRLDPRRPSWMNRDRFVLSCGHASMLQYGLLHLSGHALSVDDLRAFRQWGSKTPGHPEVHHTAGVETTTGPLGQGFGNAVGMAMAERHLAARFNREGFAVVDHRVYVIASDGDLMEGVSAEAASLAGHLQLDKLIVYWDDNHITIDGRTEITFTEDVLARFAAYGWFTTSVDDGRDLEALSRATEAAAASGKPSLIRVRTVIGWPAPKKQDTPSAHGSPLGKDEIAKTREAMHYTRAPFDLDPRLDDARRAIVARGAAESAAHDALLDAYRKAHPALAAELERGAALPAGWETDLPTFPPSAKGMATRKASGKVLGAIAARLPSLVGGSADLAGSNNTYLDGEPDFTADQSPARPPRNVHFGIREHAMAAALNGMALHGGVVPYGATFLVFSDYMRPSIRLAALMGLGTRYVFTHDSIGLGEDGPTHQPVEHLAALRAIPGLTVLRPSDANEATVCWQLALEANGPAALVLTRQDVPVLDRSAATRLAAADGAKRGAYVLRDPASGAPDVLLVASGSEISIALAAADVLDAKGARTRVVSMPSWEVFAAQPAEYRDQVFPPSLRARVVIEAATRFGWERWVGADGGFVTLDRFGASAPYETLYSELGITAERAVAEADRLRAETR